LRPFSRTQGSPWIPSSSPALRRESFAAAGWTGNRVELVAPQFLLAMLVFIWVAGFTGCTGGEQVLTSVTGRVLGAFRCLLSSNLRKSRRLTRFCCAESGAGCSWGWNLGRLFKHNLGAFTILGVLPLVPGCRTRGMVAGQLAGNVF